MKEKKGNTEFGLGESVILSLCQKLRDTDCFVFFDNLFTNQALLVKVLEMGIYATYAYCEGQPKEYASFEA